MRYCDTSHAIILLQRLTTCMQEATELSFDVEGLNVELGVKPRWGGHRGLRVPVRFKLCF